MIVILKQDSTQNQIDNMISWLNSFGVQVNVVTGTQKRILGLIGDTTKIDIDSIKAKEIVENVQRIQEPYKNTNSYNFV